MTVSKVICTTFAFFIFSVQVQAYDQELCLHETENHNGNFQCFRQGVPDASQYALFKIKSVCLKGLWNFYSAPNYTGYHSSRSGSSLNEALSCSFVREPFDTIKSFRYVGPQDVNWKPTLVLYTGPHWEGRQYMITSHSFGDIHEPILSIVSTGHANWTLFEGTHFDGKAVCWESPNTLYADGGSSGSNSGVPAPPNKHFHVSHSIVETNELQTVGSVTQGCESIKKTE